MDSGAGGLRNSVDEKHSLAIIVPFRNRSAQLSVFSQMMHAFFQGQKMKMKIIVIEQGDRHYFNRGKLCNIGFELSKNTSDYFCFHDVDMIPAEPFLDYTFPSDGPRQLASNIQKFGWSHPYAEYINDVNTLDCPLRNHSTPTTFP